MTHCQWIVRAKSVATAKQFAESCRLNPLNSWCFEEFRIFAMNQILVSFFRLDLPHHWRSHSGRSRDLLLRFESKMSGILRKWNS
jgi:hypothetical protein